MTMELIDCKERIQAYIRNMSKYRENGTPALHVRFLDKIFKCSMDPYTERQRRWVVQELLNIHEVDQQYVALNMLYAWKINRTLQLGMDVPTLRLDEALYLVHYKRIPPEVLKSLHERGNSHTIAFAGSLAPDCEAKEVFNIYISQDHFFRQEVTK